MVQESQLMKAKNKSKNATTSGSVKKGSCPLAAAQAGAEEKTNPWSSVAWP